MFKHTSEEDDEDGENPDHENSQHNNIDSGIVAGYQSN
jgi:hypothetical protein